MLDAVLQLNALIGNPSNVFSKCCFHDATFACIMGNHIFNQCCLSQTNIWNYHIHTWLFSDAGQVITDR
jgi:hypothetical protein